ncbi:MAG: leucine-rich repeat domain-containing protein [Lachnospiraceae bacterium]|nr:leucine-rich repeat domain-containing protein [Lachnospiraceae bacterium]
MKRKIVMKKLAAIFVAVLMACTLSACAGTQDSAKNSAGTSDASTDTEDGSDSDSESTKNSADNFEENTGTTESMEEVSQEVTLSEYTPVDFESMEESAEGDFTFTVTEDKAEITGYSGAGGQVRIPESLGGASTIYITNEAFRNNTEITCLYLPSTLTGMDNYVFSGCTSLEQVYIASPSYSHGSRLSDAMFGECTALRRVVVAEGWEYIGDYSSSTGSGPFTGCVSLTDVTLPSTITYIDDYAFYECKSLETIDLSGTSVSRIRNMAFAYCTNLKSISMPSTLYGYNFLETNAFIGCTSLTDMDFPNGNENLELVDGILYDDTTLMLKLSGYDSPDVVVREGTYLISNNAFEYDTGIISVTFPDSLYEIGRLAFNGCTSLEQVTFGLGLDSIGQSAFSNCYSLTDVDIPDSVTWIGSTCFSSSTNAVITFKGQQYTCDQDEELKAAAEAG